MTAQSARPWARPPAPGDHRAGGGQHHAVHRQPGAGGLVPGRMGRQPGRAGGCHGGLRTKPWRLAQPDQGCPGGWPVRSRGSCGHRSPDLRGTAHRRQIDGWLQGFAIRRGRDDLIAWAPRQPFETVGARCPPVARGTTAATLVRLASGGPLAPPGARQRRREHRPPRRRAAAAAPPRPARQGPPSRRPHGAAARCRG